MRGGPRLASRSFTFALLLTLAVAIVPTSRGRATTVAPPLNITQITQTVQFTPQERKWIAAHPVLRIGVDPFLPPLEFMDQGQYRGLTSDYMAAIAAASGLHFEVVPLPTEQQASALAAHRVDLLPAVSRKFTAAAIRNQLLIGTPYFVSATIVVARGYGEIIFDPHKLDGKTVALKGGGMLEQILHQRYPEVNTLRFATPGEALEAVADGRAAAAIGIDSVFLPLLYRLYRNQLHVAGTMVETPAILSIGVRRDLPELAAIVEKSLTAMNARQTDLIIARWLEQSNYTAPSWPQILRHRTFEIVLITITLLILLLALWHGWRARREAERSAQDKARFLAVMSHEIRTPMNAILASVELLARSRLTAPQRQLNDLAITASEALLEMLDDVLDLSKLEARQLTLTRSATAIQQLAQGVIDMAKLQARQKKLNILLRMDVPDGYTLMIDATRIRQILINLLSNAVKFTESGTVQLQIAVESATQETAAEAATETATNVAVAEEAGTAGAAGAAGAAEAMPAKETGEPQMQGILVLTVSDTGAGVPQDRQKDLFRPYVQVHKTSNRRFGGTGLGLTICRELCELMGGSIAFSSLAGIGTSVTCRIPVELVPLQPGEQTAEAGAGSGLASTLASTLNSTLTSALASAYAPGAAQAEAATISADDAPAGQVLVVEDHPANRLVLKQQLKQLGYSCTIVGDGRSALEQTARHHFSLMLLDCQLPDMDGYDVAAAQRAREAGGDAHLPIIAISASVDRGHLDACMDSGMDGTLHKPLRLDALRTLLNAWCGTPEASAQDRDLPAKPPDGVPGMSNPPGVSRVSSVSLLIDSTHEDLAGLHAALALRDATHAARIAHRMRGAALVCGQVPMANIVGRIETILKNGDMSPDPVQAIAVLITELQQIMTTISDSQN